MKTIDLNEVLIRKFWARVSLPDSEGCMRWLGGREVKGYGVMSFPKFRETRKSHRVSATIAYGPIPAGHQVDHICRNKICVNPLHLRFATNKENLENQPKENRKSATGVRGVTCHKATGKYRSRVSHHGVTYYLGLFETLEEASFVASEKRKELFTHSDN